MTWRYPKWVIKDTQPLDLDDLNENFYAMTEDLYGQLNEHNFATSAFDREDLADDVAVQLHQAAAYASPGARALPANALTVQSNADWSVVETHTFQNVRESMLHIIWTFQAGIQLETLAGAYGDYSAASSGWDFALRINGALVPETISGTADRANESMSIGFTPGGLQVAGDEDVRWSPGITHNRYPVLLDAVIPVDAGDVVVELVARMYAPSLHRFAVFSREVIGWEMVR
jgi:hypothetical protein